MPDLVTAIDEPAANVLVPRALAAIPPLTASGTTSLGPFGLAYDVRAVPTATGVNLVPAPADVVRITGRLDFTISLTVTIDLSFLNFCLPQVCVTLPFIGRVCTPRICVTFPVIRVPVRHSGTAGFTADFGLRITPPGQVWLVEGVVKGVPSLSLGPASAALLAAIGAAVSAALLAVPFIGPLLAIASGVIFAALTIGAVTGFLGPLLSPFLQGRTFEIFKQPPHLELIEAQAQPPAAAVGVVLEGVSAGITAGDEDELVVSLDIRP